MQTDHEAGQVSIFGPDLWYGKMCIVLEEIVRIKCGTVHVPGPYPWAWQPAGRILLGTDFSLCWRCLDAQYWGVPQRRKRIFLIADFAGRTADKVLFDSEGLHGDTAPGV